MFFNSCTEEVDWPVSLPRVRRADLTQVGYSLAGQATEEEQFMLLKPFERNAFNCDIRSLIDDRIFSTAARYCC